MTDTLNSNALPLKRLPHDEAVDIEHDAVETLGPRMNASS
jgi:hypothetical protein